MSILFDSIHIYLLLLGTVLFLYAMRHFYFSLNRLYGTQRHSYEDIVDSEIPSITVIIPMHNEEKVAHNILKALTEEDFSNIQIEIIAVNDHSTDGTATILAEWKKNIPQLKILERSAGNPGKPNGLNDALAMSNGEIVLIFDADYIPPKGLIRNLAIHFIDPEVASVMGRVVPINGASNLLTLLTSMERSGGYQVDQQARYNLHLLPQYGGTCGGFRKDIVQRLGGFNPKILAEDTDFTFKSYILGWTIIYANTADCHEETPERWKVRLNQIQRWSRGHDQVLFRQTIRFLKSPYLDWRKKIDGLFLLFIYLVPFLIAIGFVFSVFLFFFSATYSAEISPFIVLVLFYFAFGNTAPFYQIALAVSIEKQPIVIVMLPLMIVSFGTSLYASTKGFFQAVGDIFRTNPPKWVKTQRFSNTESL